MTSIADQMTALYCFVDDYQGERIETMEQDQGHTT